MKIINKIKKTKNQIAWEPPIKSKYLIPINLLIEYIASLNTVPASLFDALARFLLTIHMGLMFVITRISLFANADC